MNLYRSVRPYYRRNILDEEFAFTNVCVRIKHKPRPLLRFDTFAM